MSATTEMASNLIVCPPHNGATLSEEVYSTSVSPSILQCVLRTCACVYAQTQSGFSPAECATHCLNKDQPLWDCSKPQWLG